MQDVIFNGSGLRKPASRSSVELVFDNADARAGGQWNQFTEIAVKRVLTRDGTSSYYINNQPVRRRDVQDVSLGTGLGPRAYAIIGQGTISRIIESKPEELRMFLEEAAGVSKYKERRRETENRLKDTRENLTRVDDILRELNSNLDKLEKQAEVAAQYRSLQDAGTLKLHQLWFLKHRDAASEEERVKKAVLEATTALESRLAELRHVEAQLETVRQAHYAASDELHTAQGSLAEASLEVSRLEERIRYVVEGRQRLEQRLAGVKAQNEQWGERQGLALPDAGRLAELQQQTTDADEAKAVADERAHELGEAVPALDEQRRTQQEVVNRETARQAELSARLDALRALQEKVQTEGKLKPWLAKHGLEGLQGLWTKIHIEPGWETALESALRERMNALEVGRVETVRAFADDAPPAKLAFYTTPVGAIANTHQTLPRLSDLLRLGDAGLKALLNDWLEGVYTAASIDEALANRTKLTHGEVIMTREGHAVSQFAVAFYAPDSEQAGMLQRAQEIENLERQLRAQALIAEEAKSALVRSEAAYTESAMRLVTVRREAAEAQTRAHQLHVELLRLSQQAEAASSRRAQLEEELAEIGRASCRERG